MSIYPNNFDSDSTIIRVDDNVTEIGGEAINQLRDAVFNIEKELGLGLSGSFTSLSDRLNVSINSDGTIKASALASAGLVTLPITDSQVGNNAGIKESKLALDYSTSDLYALVTGNISLTNILATNYNTLLSTVNSHIGGSPTTALRHVASHIDLNSVPSDIRDVTFIWSGLKDKNGNPRSATTVASAIDQINSDLINHENISSVISGSGAHPASGISVDTSSFVELPKSSTSVQDVLNAIDNSDTILLGTHRNTMHSNGVPTDTRSQSLTNPDGYRETIVSPTRVVTHIAHNPPGTIPQDSITVGDDIVSFVPTNTNYIFDSQFSQVKVGDDIRINYGNGLEALFQVESIRYTPGSEWVIRINGTNLFDTDGYGDGYAYARIDRSLYDDNTYGVLAVAAANAPPHATFNNIPKSVIVGNPRGASALGIGFNPNQLDSNHYKLWLELYPTGNPVDKVISLPAIDVTGDLGASPGKYTLESVVAATNDSFRQTGYNYRFIAFEYEGNFGIMLADAINKASFAIISGSNNSGTLTEATYTKNVVGNVYADQFDALGFGYNKADVASPAYQSTFIDATAAQLPTKVIFPLKNRSYISNGFRKDEFAATYLADANGAWPATIISRTVVGVTTVEVTYEIDLCLTEAGLKPGKTIVVQPAIEFSNPLYSNVDYGRFIIKDVTYINPCPGSPAKTQITVINGIHAAGIPVSASAATGLNVKIFFGYDSVAFNFNNAIDSSPSSIDYHRLHEIYITGDGKTFSHERARMPIQTELSSPAQLGTSLWHIHDVSSKLRGYKDTGSLHRYVRFYVLSYDTSSGEFDGYLGKKGTGDNVERCGQIVRGRKNTKTRFYDETNIDYVELEFREAAAANSILSTALARHVDIELFPSLEENDTNLLLAVCEVNWHPSTGYPIIEHVKNKIKRGSISEKEFTQTAIDFINTGNSLLHANGVISGLDYRAQNSSDSRDLFFNGGVAIVDGAAVMVNNNSVTIPQVYNNLYSLPQSVNWAVCVDKFGNLIPIMLTTQKEQVFTTDLLSSQTYYVPSVTLAELTISRKDLTIIAVVNDTVNSVTINSVKDARRFVAKETFNIPFTWVPDSESNLSDTLLTGSNVNKSDKLIGHFKTFDAVKNWITYYGANNSTVIVKGTHAFSSSDTLDLTGLTSKLTIKGENATLVFNAGRGIQIGPNVELRDIHFVYNPSSITFDPNDMINTGYGAIYAATDFDNPLTDVTIDNCVFESPQLARGRGPFINVELHSNSLVDKFTVRNCKFKDNQNGLNQPRLAAIAFINLNDGANPAIVANTRIENNDCNLSQGIYLTSKSATNTFSAPGLIAAGVSIHNNLCGTIGYLIITSASTTIDYYGTLNASSIYKPFNLSISNNKCKLIASCRDNGKIIIATTHTVNYATGNVDIKNNSCNWIQVLNQNFFGISDLLISGNSLYCDSTAYLTPIAITTENYAIKVDTSWHGIFDLDNSCRIIDNTMQISGGIASFYNSGIVTFPPSIVTGNNINGIKDGYGISIGTLGNATENVIVTNNNIRRSGQDIKAYVLINGGKGIISNNIFDGYYVDGAATDSKPIKDIGEVYLLPPTGRYLYNIVNNKNNLEYITLHGHVGTMAVNSAVSSGGDPDNYISNNFSNMGANLIYNANSASPGAITYEWVVPLRGLLPDGAELIQISFDAIITATPNTLNTLALYVKYLDANTQYIASSFPLGLTTYTVKINGLFVNNLTAPEIRIIGVINDSSLTPITAIIGNSAGTKGLVLTYIT